MPETTYEGTAWMDRAACRGKNAAAMYPVNDNVKAVEYAKDICAGCPVRAECLSYALDRNEYQGVWGATTGDERKSLKRNQLRRDRAASAAEAA